MDVLPIVKHLRDLSADPANRATIVKDQSCIQSLVLFLDNPNAAVIQTSLEALKNLAQYPGNRLSMRSELGMLQSLRLLVDSSDASDCRKLAEEVYQLLLPATTSRAPSTPAATNSSFFKMGSVKNARTITLQIYGMTEPTCRKILEEEILHVSGVVSYTFDLSRYRCVVRCKTELRPASLCEAVANTGFLTAKQVVKNENGEDTFIEFNATPAKASPERKVDTPDYLPEADETEFREQSNKAVQRTGQDGQQGGWFGTVGTFISKNLYW